MWRRNYSICTATAAIVIKPPEDGHVHTLRVFHRRYSDPSLIHQSGIGPHCTRTPTGLYTSIIRRHPVRSLHCYVRVRLGVTLASLRAGQQESSPVGRYRLPIWHGGLAHKPVKQKFGWIKWLFAMQALDSARPTK